MPKEIDLDFVLVADVYLPIYHYEQEQDIESFSWEGKNIDHKKITVCDGEIEDLFHYLRMAIHRVMIETINP